MQPNSAEKNGKRPFLKVIDENADRAQMENDSSGQKKRRIR